MALDNYYDCCVFPPLEWDWELRTLGDAAQEGIHDDFLPAMCVDSPVSSSEASSGGGGYLEDAVAHWSDRCKRQRMVAPPSPRPMANEDLQCLLQSFWDSSSGEGDPPHDFKIMIPETSSFASEEDDALGWERKPWQVAGGPPSAAVLQAPALQLQEGGGEAAPLLSTSGTGSLRLQKATTGAPELRSNYCHDSRRAVSSSALQEKENRGIRVLYPFAVIKPLGLDDGGTTTLSDINQRILKRPARPVRHPVGQFACSPAVSPHGLGLSGKAVASLTKIRTGGKGTITIIRTRG